MCVGTTVPARFLFIYYLTQLTYPIWAFVCPPNLAHQGEQYTPRVWVKPTA